MNYEDLVGFRVAAPQYSIANPVAPPSPVGAVGNVGTLSPVAGPGGTSFGASGSFAIAGWLAAIVVLGVAYRLLWERAA